MFSLLHTFFICYIQTNAQWEQVTCKMLPLHIPSNSHSFWYYSFRWRCGTRFARRLSLALLAACISAAVDIYLAGIYADSPPMRTHNNDTWWPQTNGAQALASKRPTIRRVRVRTTLQCARLDINASGPEDVMVQDL